MMLFLVERSRVMGVHDEVGGCRAAWAQVSRHVDPAPGDPTSEDRESRVPRSPLCRGPSPFLPRGCPPSILSLYTCACVCLRLCAPLSRAERGSGGQLGRARPAPSQPKRCCDACRARRCSDLMRTKATRWDALWAATFIPMPVPKPVCRTSVNNKWVRYMKFLQLFWAGVWV